ncbi:hypothetical protein F5B19DRAFT_300024 [Rostrohypoxylon terebratum]|nr:hypothetical protein F5B19DRAFT_300024 [Rostrohypoxylon terebratum]
MLAIDPSKRPLASEVSARLFLLALRTNYDSVTNIFDQIGSDLGWHMAIQKKKFMIWAQVVGLDDESMRHQQTSLLVKGKELGRVFSLVEEIEQDLSFQVKSQGDPNQPESRALYHEKIQLWIDGLWDMAGIVSKEATKKMTSQLKDYLISEATSKLFPVVPDPAIDHSKLSIILAMKQTSESLDAFAPSENFELEEPSWHALPPQKEIELGWIGADKSVKTYMLAELLQYEDKWIDRTEELLARVNGLVSLLNKPDIVEAFPLLKCRHFYHDSQRNAFKLLYEIPRKAKCPNDEPIIFTLSSLILKTQDRKQRPPLGDVFFLAHKLASSIMAFHQAGWFHKAVSSSNIVFFPSDDKVLRNELISPYIIGFNHSREGRQDAFTVGPPEVKGLKDYQHPEYSRHYSKLRFREEFDYYSIGMVLLELALWKSLGHILNKHIPKDAKPEDVRTRLLEDVVPELGSYMGKLYEDAVKMCLDGTFSEQIGGDQPWSQFEKNVVWPLEKCLALCPGSGV